MKILGIDPGIGRLGWGLIDSSHGQYTFLECGCFETPIKSELSSRLEKIYDFLIELIEKSKPDEMAMEMLFFQRNVTTAFDVGASRGVTMLAGRQKKLEIFQYTPLQVKSSLTGYGKAEKSQVEFMVKQILHLKDKIRPDDAADAVAIALTHAFSHKKALSKDRAQTD